MNNKDKGFLQKVFQSVLFSVFKICLLQPAVAYGQQSGCGTNPLQDWYFVRPEKPLVKLTGTIDRIKLNAPDETVLGSFNDFDWNIYVIPDDKSLLINSRNRANSDGLIELEVQSRGRPDNLKDLFPVGTRIEAYGEWVEDLGHDPDKGYDTDSKGGKTELHPLYWMKTTNKNPTHIYMAQDDSGRFVNAQNVLWEEFKISTPSQFPKVTPWHTVPSRTQIFHEEASIARGTSRAFASPSGYTPSVYLDSWLFYNCDSGPRVICGDSCGHSPYYVAGIERYSMPLLNETVTYSVSTDIGSGQKIAYLNVIAELDSPPQGVLLYAKWQYEDSAGVVNGIAEETSNPPTHRLSFSMPYAPALGYNKNSWRLSVSGSTQAYGQLQPLTSQLFTDSFVRTFVTEGRTYALNPSSISLDRESKRGGCDDVVYLSINQSKLLPQIALRSLRWKVKILRDSDGFTIDSPEEILITPDSPLRNQGFTARTYRNPNEKRLDIEWEKLSSGQTNLTHIVVTAQGITELGEEVQTFVALSPLCGLGIYSSEQVLDYTYRLLAKEGLSGELYKIVKKVSEEDKKWLEAFAKFLHGKRISDAEKELLVMKVKQGSQLPPLPCKKKLQSVAR